MTPDLIHDTALLTISAWQRETSQQAANRLLYRDQARRWAQQDNQDHYGARWMRCEGRWPMTTLDYDRDIAPASHRLHVVRYEPTFGAHVCTVDDDPRHIRVDLFVNGDFDEEVSPESLIGKTVEVEYTHGFLFLAHNVRIVDETPAESATRTDEVSAHG